MCCKTTIHGYISLTDPTTVLNMEDNADNVLLYNPLFASVLWLPPPQTSQLMFPATLCLTPRRRGHNSDVYRSFSLGWIYFYKSIQICFCAAYCTRGVNVLYKVFRSGIRFPPNSISQFSVLSGAFIILTVADKAIIFPPATTKCRQVLLWQCVCLRGGGGTQILIQQSLMARTACYKAISSVTQRKQMLGAFVS